MEEKLVYVMFPPLKDHVCGFMIMGHQWDTRNPGDILQVLTHLFLAATQQGGYVCSRERAPLRAAGTQPRF